MGTAYNERVSRVENQIMATLRDRLGTVRNANEILWVNELFVGPKVRAFFRCCDFSAERHLCTFVVRYRSNRLNF